MDNWRAVLGVALAMSALFVTGVAHAWECDANRPPPSPSSIRFAQGIILRGHSSDVWHSEINADGTRVVTASMDCHAILWNAATGEPIQVLRHPGQVRHAAFSPNGAQFATGNDSSEVRIYESATGRLLRTLNIDRYSEVARVRFNTDGSRIAAVGDAGAHVWETETGRELMVLPADDYDPAWDVAFSSDGARILTRSWSMLRIWDGVTGRMIAQHGARRSIIDADQNFESAVFSRDGGRIVASQGNLTHVFDSADGELLLTLRGHREKIMEVAISADGRRIATASFDDTTRIWETQTGRELLQLQPDRTITALRFNGDGTRLLTAALGGGAQIWDASTGAEIAHFREGEGLWSAFLSADERRLITASEDNDARIWQLP
jgi:WD40 repeat protein